MIKQIKPDAVRPNVYDCMDKINELIDAVNALQSRLDSSTEPEIPADPYAEQRKWIGKLCWFWDCPGAPRCIDILVKIDKKHSH